MDLRIIDFVHVLDDKRMRDRAPTKLRRHFDTFGHSPNEARNLSPVTVSKAPYSLARWLPLVMHIQDLPASAAQTVSIDWPWCSEVELLADMRQEAIRYPSAIPSPADVADWPEDILSKFGYLDYSDGGLRMRLEGIDLCDENPRHGRSPLHSAVDVMERLVDSECAMDLIDDFFTKIAQDQIPETSLLRLCFLPFNTRFRPAMRYRIFCAPSSLQITAISQYLWNAPWRAGSGTSSLLLPDEIDELWRPYARRTQGHIWSNELLGDYRYSCCLNREQMEDIARRILSAAHVIHSKILRSLTSPEDDLFRQQGFTFDINWDVR